MAISKEILNNKKKTNQPKPLGTVPETNPEHVSGPVDFHHPIPAKPILHNSFGEAVNACEQIFLKPGEAHTEFYQTNGIIHCVVGIGNYNPGHKHLYLSDSGDKASIADQLNAMNEQIVLMGKKVDNVYETLTEKFSTLQEVVNGEITTLNTKFNDLSTNINAKVDNLETAVEEQLANMQAIINQAVEDITEFKQEIEDRVESIEARVENISSKLSDINTSINNDLISFKEEVNNNILVINSSIDELREKDVEIELALSDLQLDINELKAKDLEIDSSIEDIKSDISVLTDAIVEINQHIDASINEFQPITDSSIESLFHDDIWTVNLCCYTIGGHIEINDGVSGGIDPRVAPCTPPNEYKTYVNGDVITLNAVANKTEGYAFVKWLKDGEEEILDSAIQIVVDEDDINCIGITQYSEDDHEPLRHGYTAVFKRLHRLAFRFIVDVIGEYEEPAPTRNIDNIEIIVKHGEEIIQNISVKDNEDVQYVYVGDEESVDIRIIPDETHIFNNYLINGTHIQQTSELHYDDINEDINIQVNLTEKWIKLGADAEPANVGSIVGNMKSYKISESVALEAYVIDNNYKFDHWEDSDPSVNLSDFLIEGTINDTDIVVDISSAVDKFNIKGLFVLKPISVVFKDWDGTILLEDTIPYGSIPASPSAPTRPDVSSGDEDYPNIEYTFDSWDHNINEPVVEDTVFTAQYSEKLYNLVTKYIRENAENISDEKDYLLLSALTNSSENIAYNADFNPSSQYINYFVAKVNNFTTFDELVEFELPQDVSQPTMYINTQYYNNNVYLYVKDQRPEYEGDGNHNGYLIASGSSNKFTKLESNISNVGLNGIWEIDNSSIYNKNTKKSIRYNQTSPRFTVYGPTSNIVNFAKLYYKQIDKKYKNNMLSFSANRNSAKVIYTKYGIASDNE